MVEPGRTRFQGHTAVVVGAGRSIGRATAIRLAREGATLIAIDAPDEPLMETAALVEAEGCSVETHVVPLDDPHALLGLGATLAHHERIDVLVSYQMDFDFAGIETCDLDNWERVIRVTLTGPLAVTKALLPALRRAPAGAVVLVGSVDGIFGNPFVPSYSAGKGGLLALTHVMAHELAHDGIRVNYVARVASSDLDRPIPPEYQQQLIAATPLARFGDPDETAAAIAFLASDDASYITGATLKVDGGRTTITHGTA